MALCWQEAGPPHGGCELPRLLTSSGAAPRKPVDLNGAASFGDIVVEAGSGRAERDAAGGPGAVAAMNLDVRVQLAGVQLDEEEVAAGEEGGWQTVWEKELLFSDDSQHLARVAEFSQVQRKHTAQAQVRQLVVVAGICGYKAGVGVCVDGCLEHMRYRVVDLTLEAALLAGQLACMLLMRCRCAPEVVDT